MKNPSSVLLLVLLLLVVGCSDNEDSISGTIKIGSNTYAIKNAYYSVEVEEDGDDKYYMYSVYFFSEGLKVIKKDKTIDDVTGLGAMSYAYFEGNDAKGLDVGKFSYSFLVAVEITKEDTLSYVNYGLPVEVKKSSSGNAINYMFKGLDDNEEENGELVTVSFTGKVSRIEPVKEGN